MAKVTKKSGSASSPAAYNSKSKKSGKAKKQYGPKEQKPKAYKGQGR